MKEHIIIAVVGLTGSGKTEAVKQFIKAGFARVGFNDPLYEELDRRGLEHTQENERPAREEMRKKEGMAVMALRSLPKVRAFLQAGTPIVIESLYSWSEYKVMKEQFGEQFKTLAIYTPPDARYARLSGRLERPLTRAEAQARDYAEIENIEKAGPVAMADWTMINTSDKKTFLKNLEELIQTVRDV